MTTETAMVWIDELERKAEKDNDAILFVYFSREQDKFEGSTVNMDGGDALIVIGYLVKQFGLSAEAIAATEAAC